MSRQPKDRVGLFPWAWACGALHLLTRPAERAHRSFEGAECTAPLACAFYVFSPESGFGTVRFSISAFVAAFLSTTVLAACSESNNGLSFQAPITGASITSSPAVATQIPGPIGVGTKRQTSQCPCLYVVNSYARPPKVPSITLYSAGANGDVAPDETISGSATKLHDPEGIALDSGGNIYVTVHYEKQNRLTVYSAGRASLDA
jgi:hypothetical protein